VPSGSQALSFLEWIWARQPEAEVVRRTLPRLYRLVLEDVERGIMPGWSTARERAMVYVASRRWVSVTSEDLFLDDLGEDRLKGLLTGLELATPGHFGETPDEQRRVGALLGIRLLSTRFKLVLQPEDTLSLPPDWLGELHAIIELATLFTRDGTEDAPPIALPDTRYYARLRKSLVDDGVVTHSWDAHAARDGDRILLCGEPREFMADLCRVVLQWTGLSGRRDLDDLAPAISQLIVYMGHPNEFSQRLSEVREQRGLTPQQPTPPPPEPATEPQPTDVGEERNRAPVVPPAKPTDDGKDHGVETTRPSPRPGEDDGGRGAQPSVPTPRPTLPSGERPEESGKPPPQPSEPSDEPGDALPEPPGPSGGWTPEDRERRLQSLRRQMRELLGAEPLPPEPEEQPSDRGAPRTLASDRAYRDAVLAFERDQGRYAEAKDTGQPGFDIDSYDKPPEDPSRVLVRRIEVKGFGTAWTDDNTVELSDRQFLDAYNKKNDGIPIGEDFDYWLYVVERREDGSLHPLPIRNPSRRTAKFEFRGGTWRDLAEEGSAQTPQEGDD
jgi:hypothetical protein